MKQKTTMTSHIPESPRLYLSPLSLSHLNAYHALNSDPRISRWSYAPLLTLKLNQLFNHRLTSPSNRPPTKDLEKSKMLLLSRVPGVGREFMENYGIILKHSNSKSPRNGTVAKRKEEKEEKGDGGEEMIGILGIPRLSPDGAAAEVGYAILPEYWGRGFASEALILFTSYYFNSTRTFPSFPPPPFLPLFLGGLMVKRSKEINIDEIHRTRSERDTNRLNRARERSERTSFNEGWLQERRICARGV